MKNYFLYLFLVLTACAHAGEPGVSRHEVTVNRLAGNSSSSLLKIVPLEKEENISMENSLLLTTPESQYYFLAVDYGHHQGCKLVFLDVTNRKIVSDGDFFFDKCNFSRPPEILSINQDNSPDFRVWVTIPHQLGSNVKVDHSLDFIYKDNCHMFCENDTNIPCNKIPR